MTYQMGLLGVKRKPNSSGEDKKYRAYLTTDSTLLN